MSAISAKQETILLNKVAKHISADPTSVRTSFLDDEDSVMSSVISFFDCLSIRHFQSLADSNCKVFESVTSQCLYYEDGTTCIEDGEMNEIKIQIKKISMKPFWTMYAIEKEVLIDTVVTCAEKRLFGALNYDRIRENSKHEGGDFVSFENRLKNNNVASIKILSEGTRLLHENDYLVPTDLFKNAAQDGWSIQIKFLEPISRYDALDLINDAFFVDGVWYTESAECDQLETETCFLITLKHIRNMLQKANQPSLRIFFSGSTIEDHRYAERKSWKKNVLVIRYPDEATVQVRLFTIEDYDCY